ncbi:MAG: ATP cone domain-containing protein, partial [Candidatus Paceibacterota bacterium]
MQVIKRDQTREPICFDKISSRIKHLCTGTDIEGKRYGAALNTLDPIRLTMKVIEYIKDGITTRELDEHTAESATMMAFENPEYGDLAGRILVSNHHKNTLDSFSITMKRLYEYKDEQGRNSPLVSRDLYKFVERYGKILDSSCEYLRDYLFDYTGFKTLERSYLIKYQSG